MRHLHLDPLGGLAGDMFLAAVLDAFPELAAGTVGAMRAAGLPEEWRVDLVPHHDGAFAGRRLVIEGPEGPPGAHTGDFGEIRARIAGAPLERAVGARALAIFALLAEAEAAVHGIAVDEVHFHELADWDSLADVVGAAWLIDALGGASWSCAALPRGGGRVETRHGPLPVPAPATARLLEGFSMVDDGIAGERVTPTGAAILRHLGPAGRLPPGAWRLGASGMGFGSKRLHGIANVLRVLAHHPTAAGRMDEQVAVIAFEVDDQSPEDLAAGLDAVRRMPGVLDVIQLPAFAKKGRLATQVQVLSRPEALDAAIDACFAETTTIGLRWRLEARAVLRRKTVTVQAEEVEVPVKVVTRPGDVRTAKAESGTIGASGGQGARARLRRAAEARALGEADHDEGG